jgi:hypothetical protein
MRKFAAAELSENARLNQRQAENIAANSGPLSVIV